MEEYQIEAEVAASVEGRAAEAHLMVGVEAEGEVQVVEGEGHRCRAFEEEDCVESW